MDEREHSALHAEISMLGFLVEMLLAHLLGAMADEGARHNFIVRLLDETKEMKLFPKLGSEMLPPDVAKQMHDAIAVKVYAALNRVRSDK